MAMYHDIFPAYLALRLFLEVLCGVSFFNFFFLSQHLLMEKPFFSSFPFSIWSHNRYIRAKSMIAKPHVRALPQLRQDPQ